MTTKYFCDICDEELDEERDKENYRADIPKPSMSPAFLVEINVEILTEGDYCKNCILKCLDTLDDRPQEKRDDKDYNFCGECEEEMPGLCNLCDTGIGK